MRVDLFLNLIFMFYIKLFFAALAAATFSVFAFRKLALYLNIVDMPDGGLKKQSKPVPYLGGLALYISFWGTLYFIVPDFNLIQSLFVGTTIVTVLGLIDDVITLTPSQKMFGQILAGVWLVTTGFCLAIELPFYLQWAISLLWIVGLMNALNLVDVMDGLCVTIAAWSSLGVFGYTLYLEQLDLAAMLMVFLAGLVAFFLFNSPSATVYLGDTGSMLLGVVIASLSLKVHWEALHNNRFINLLVPVIILGIPIVEIISLIVVRKVKKIPFYQGSPDHYAHFLQRKGWNKWHILLYTTICSLGLIATSFFAGLGYLNFIPLALIAGVLFCVWVHIVYRQ